MKRSKKSFSHLDSEGKAVMVNVGHKPEQSRRAVAMGFIRMQKATVRALKKKALPKGDVLTVAKIAGIQGAKKTHDLIPLCHPLALHEIDLSFRVKADGVEIRSVVESTGKTGVEMEALTAVSVATLTLYDMCKAIDKTMVIGPITLLEKIKR